MVFLLTKSSINPQISEQIGYFTFERWKKKISLSQNKFKKKQLINWENSFSTISFSCQLYLNKLTANR